VLNKILEVTEEQWLSVNKNNREKVEEFLKQSTQLSPYTLGQYRSALQIYFWWVHENLQDKNFWELKSRDYLFYQNYLVERGLSSSAIRFKRSSVSTFNNYIELYYQDEYKGFRNYVNKGIALPPKNFVYDKEPLSLDEYNNLCKNLEKKELWQQLAYLRISFSTGARRNEIKQLLKEIVNYDPKIVGESKIYSTNKVRCKGRGIVGKVRVLQFDQDAMDAIKKWLSIRGEDDCPYLFIAKQKGKVNQISSEGINRWCSSVFEKIVGRRIHPHLLRETRATTMVVEQGKDIKIAQKLLGHINSSTTEIYVIRNDENDSDEAFT
jgi:site-specific recombinase XerD